MLRHSLKRIAQLATGNLQNSASADLATPTSSSSFILLKEAARTCNNWPQPSNLRWFSSSNTAAASDDAPPSTRETYSNNLVAAPPSTSSAPPSIAAADAALDAWGDAMDEGDWESAWEIFESKFSVTGPEFPDLEELLAWDPDAEDKAVRRQREEAMQQETARARVRRVDGEGRAHGVGKRKTSVARVWIRLGPGHVMVNKRPYDSYFPSLPRRNDVLTPFFVTDTLGQFDVMAAVEGGGSTGQAQALRHGIAKALQNWDPEVRPVLKSAGLLTRDARIVERKKPGRKKARKSFAFVKR